jgi:hypothetical protein
MQEAVADEVGRRQQQAVEEIAAKYASGKGGVEESVKAPTGSAYMQKDSEERKAKKERMAARDAAEMPRTTERDENQDPNSDDEGADDDNYSLRKIREQRLREIKVTQREKIENVGKGHGTYREIVEEDFLKEMCSSDRVICHFYHRDFERCKIMDHHLERLSHRHLETKFVKIDAEKAPFFVSKLLIRTMPTLCFFFDGVAQEKVLGFEGLSEEQPEGKEDEWPTIRLARLMGNCNIINMSKVFDDDGIEAAHQAKLEEMKKSIFSGIRADGVNQVEDDDFDLDNIDDIDFQP